MTLDDRNQRPRTRWHKSPSALLSLPATPTLGYVVHGSIDGRLYGEVPNE
ncbi:hypothetical protein [Halocatena pleomorpha]|nr:hypothetical protein [Halocatena pleomorpha]